MRIMPELNFQKTVEEISEFIRRVIDDAKASGTIIGLSGGVDSSITAALCVQALGKKRVLAVLMPTDFTPQEDMDDAINLANKLKIESKIININNICGSFFRTLKADYKDSNQKIPMGNIIARVRMIILYYYANILNYLVAGTSDRSEALIGFFTKYGDGGADFYPTIHLYKSQIRELAEYLGIPKKISYKPSSPQLYPGHKATDEIPIDYSKLDPILVGLFDQKLSVEDTSGLTGISIKTVDEVHNRFIRSKHKRTFPPMIKKWE